LPALRVFFVAFNEGDNFFVIVLPPLLEAFIAGVICLKYWRRNAGELAPQ